MLVLNIILLVILIAIIANGTNIAIQTIFDYSPEKKEEKEKGSLSFSLCKCYFLFSSKAYLKSPQSISN